MTSLGKAGRQHARLLTWLRERTDFSCDSVDRRPLANIMTSVESDGCGQPLFGSLLPFPRLRRTATASATASSIRIPWLSGDELREIADMIDAENGDGKKGS